MVPEDVVARVATTLETSTNRARRLVRTALPAGFVLQVSGRARVVLVEGPTDVAVLGVLLGGRVPVVAAGGKHLLPLAAALAGALGTAVDVVLDGDDGPGAGHRARQDSLRVRAELTGVPVHVLPGDLETCLARWPAFVRALPRGLTKDAGAYARAAAAALPEGAPPVLGPLVADLLSR
ncbi:hypothetical protein AB2L27_17680 [Kineococcus sp. LSe6-4]|uniref:Toprim domain-containing protein n=1 Tax=Kineococcus halophytocola TaxID=3234027 RepID=A0ABV4H7D7_9ACTN